MANESHFIPGDESSSALARANRYVTKFRLGCPEGLQARSQVIYSPQEKGYIVSLWHTRIIREPNA